MLLTTELDKLSGTDWQLFFAQERAKPYFAELDAFVTAAAAEKTVYPAAENIFAAFRACPVSAVRVVVLGQDPAAQARSGHGAVLLGAGRLCRKLRRELHNIF